MTVFKNALVYGELTDIAVEDGIIKKIGKIEDDGMDLGGVKLYPGLIDTHSHGCLGYDASDLEDHLGEMAEYELAHGITTWYPTTMTISLDDLSNIIKRDLNVYSGANMPGFHMEGPFINVKCKGAQNESYVIPANMDAFNLCNASGQVKKITVAPECEGAIEFIKKCPALVSIGHTECDYDTASAAFSAGAKCITHTYNTMPGIHHRAPGPIGAGSDAEGVYAELICDGIHIHESAVRMLIKIFGEDRVVLISDSVRACGLPDGIYDLGGLNITVKDGVARTEGGNLAGSTTNLFNCVKKAISFGISEESAVKMASENPARMMGLNKGKIEVGYDADFIAVDSDFNLLFTVVGGRVYGK